MADCKINETQFVIGHEWANKEPYNSRLKFGRKKRSARTCEAVSHSQS